MELVRIDSAGSTSTYLAGIADGCCHGTAVMAREQTAGRGQRGNSWEAEPGKNVTMSILLRPEGLEPARQFVISQAVSLAMVEMLDCFIGAEPVSIKWPNDIYVGDSKIAGILIENVISGTEISRTIVGIGLNVNQTEFVSDAPNTVSLKGLMPKADFDVDALGEALARDVIEKTDRALSSAEAAAEVAEAYFARMWRGDGGYHPYYDHMRGVYMEARIDAVAATGHITLTDRADGEARVYAFKEISAVL